LHIKENKTQQTTGKLVIFKISNINITLNIHIKSSILMHFHITISMCLDWGVNVWGFEGVDVWGYEKKVWKKWGCLDWGMLD